MALLEARHEQHRDISNKNTLVEVAESVHLNITQLRNNLSNHQLLTKLADDHTFAVEQLGVFGTPTLVFPENQAIYLKLSSLPKLSECLDVFNELHHLVEKRLYIQEIKRP